jgi:S-formylglutathione hydrolase FrmB
VHDPRVAALSPLNWSPLNWSLLSGPLPAVLLAAGAVAGVYLLRPRGPRRRWWLRVVPLTIGIGVGVVGVAGLLIDSMVAAPLPPTVGAWAAALGVAIATAVAARAAGAGRVAVLGALALVLLASVSGINGYYGQFPTVRTALGSDYTDEIDFGAAATPAPRLIRRAGGAPLAATWSPPAGMPATGRVAQVDIPGPVSGFAARPGWVYLPPSYLSGVRAQLPVLVLLPGQPGDSRDWLDGGRLAQRMDAFAAGHRGLAPVVLMPDALGSELANPLCLDSALGNAAGYLTVDVPAWIRLHLQIDPDPASWAVGGFSYGGTCALQLALTAPQVYPTFLDISGQSEPSLGTRADTVHAAFGDGAGADAAFRAVNPLDLLATRRYPQTAGALVAGADDPEFRPQADTVFAALQAAGVPSTLTVLPGGHTWAVWGPGLDASLPWLGSRLGLT